MIFLLSLLNGVNNNRASSSSRVVGRRFYSDEVLRQFDLVRRRLRSRIATSEELTLLIRSCLVQIDSSDDKLRDELVYKAGEGRGMVETRRQSVASRKLCKQALRMVREATKVSSKLDGAIVPLLSLEGKICRAEKNVLKTLTRKPKGFERRGELVVVEEEPSLEDDE